MCFLIKYSNELNTGIPYPVLISPHQIYTNHKGGDVDEDKHIKYFM